MINRIMLLFTLILTIFSTVNAQRELGVRPTASGGVLMAEQAAYDVKSYDLDVRFDIANRLISGRSTVKAVIVNSITKFVLDLDTPFAVDAVSLVAPVAGKKDISLKFERKGGQIWIDLPQPAPKTGEEISIRVVYKGKPREAPRPPWVGGFVWSKTADGSPWVGVACQNDGADLWFPVKDHPSDEADTASLHFTVPQNLVAASNGKLKSVVKNKDSHTFNWEVAQPINNYNITVNIAPYKTVEDKMKSVAGDEIPIVFYVLPENLSKAQGLINQTKDFVKFFEEYLGPYPFRSEKLGFAETSYLGMEHQTMLSYGNKFQNNEHGFDGLMFHELGHEWFGNLLTAKDWNDFWLHEGFQSFMDTLYLERLKSKEVYQNAMVARQKATRNAQPVAPREPRMAFQMYMTAPDYLNSDGDIYGKGAAVLHSLRYVVGDEAFFRALRKFTYPKTEMERITNGKQTRFATTDEFQQIVEAESKMKLDWFFEMYLRQPKLPRLATENVSNQFTFVWETPNNLPFPMPVEAKIGDILKKMEMNGEKQFLPTLNNQPIALDPNNWILKAQ